MHKYLLLYYAWATIGVCILWLNYRTEAFHGFHDGKDKIESSVRECHFKDENLQETIDKLPLVAERVIASPDEIELKDEKTYSLQYKKSDQEIVSFDGKVLYVPHQITDTKRFVKKFVNHYIPCDFIEVY